MNFDQFDTNSAVPMDTSPPFVHSAAIAESDGVVDMETMEIDAPALPIDLFDVRAIGNAIEASNHWSDYFKSKFLSESKENKGQETVLGGVRANKNRESLFDPFDGVPIFRNSSDYNLLPRNIFSEESVRAANERLRECTSDVNVAVNIAPAIVYHAKLLQFEEKSFEMDKKKVYSMI